MTGPFFCNVMGDGAFGVVHHLFDPATNVTVARKYFFDIKKFEIERDNWQQVKSPHIVPFLASGCELPMVAVRSRGKKVNGQLSYLDMPLMECGSLFDIGFIPLKASILKLPCELTADLVYSWGLCILHGLNYLHTHLLKIHGDIKPGNILIDNFGSAMIADLGAMQELPAAGQKMHPAGTNYYMPPEVHSNGKLTFQIDVWSLGVTLYEVCDGQKPWSKIKYCATAREAIELIKIGNVPFGIFRKITMSDKLVSLLQLCLIKDCDSRPSPAQILDLPSQRNWRPPRNWPQRDWSFTTPAELDLLNVKNEKEAAAKAAESTIAELRRHNEKTIDRAKSELQKERALLHAQFQKQHDDEVNTITLNSDAARTIMESKLVELAESKKAVDLGMCGLSKEIDVLNSKVREMDTNAVAMEASYEAKLALQSSKSEKASRSKRRWKCLFNELKSDLSPILHKYAARNEPVEEEEDEEIEEVEEEDEDGDQSSAVFSPNGMLSCRPRKLITAKSRAKHREPASVEVINIDSPADLVEEASNSGLEASSTTVKRKSTRAPNLNWDDGEEERLGADLKDLVDEVFDQEQLRIITNACIEFSVGKDAVHAFLELVAKNFKEVAAGTEIEYELSSAAGKLADFFPILNAERWHRYEKYFAFVCFVKCTDSTTKQTTAYFGTVAQMVFQKRATKESYDYRVKECLKTFEKFSAVTN